jgi:hypothetical protein
LKITIIEVFKQDKDLNAWNLKVTYNLNKIMITNLITDFELKLLKSNIYKKRSTIFLTKLNHNILATIIDKYSKLDIEDIYNLLEGKWYYSKEFKKRLLLKEIYD